MASKGPARVNNINNLEGVQLRHPLENNPDFFEEQEAGVQGCGRHALNNLLGGKYFITTNPRLVLTDDIFPHISEPPIPLTQVCNYLSTKGAYNEEDGTPLSCPAEGEERENWDNIVLETALGMLGYSAESQSDDWAQLKERNLREGHIGYLVNHGANHWVAYKKIQGSNPVKYNLVDSRNEDDADTEYTLDQLKHDNADNIEHAFKVSFTGTFIPLRTFNTSTATECSFNVGELVEYEGDIYKVTNRTFDTEESNQCISVTFEQEGNSTHRIEVGREDFGKLKKVAPGATAAGTALVSAMPHRLPINNNNNNNNNNSIEVQPNEEQDNEDPIDHSSHPNKTTRPPPPDLSNTNAKKYISFGYTPEDLGVSTVFNLDISGSTAAIGGLSIHGIDEFNERFSDKEEVKEVMLVYWRVSNILRKKTISEPEIHIYRIPSDQADRETLIYAFENYLEFANGLAKDLGETPSDKHDVVTNLVTQITRYLEMLREGKEENFITNAEVDDHTTENKIDNLYFSILPKFFHLLLNHARDPNGQPLQIDSLLKEFKGLDNETYLEDLQRDASDIGNSYKFADKQGITSTAHSIKLLFNIIKKLFPKIYNSVTNDHSEHSSGESDNHSDHNNTDLDDSPNIVNDEFVDHYLHFLDHEQKGEFMELLNTAISIYKEGDVEGARHHLMEALTYITTHVESSERECDEKIDELSKELGKTKPQVSYYYERIQEKDREIKELYEENEELHEEIEELKSEHGQNIEEVLERVQEIFRSTQEQHRLQLEGMQGEKAALIAEHETKTQEYAGKKAELDGKILVLQAEALQKNQSTQQELERRQAKIQEVEALLQGLQVSQQAAEEAYSAQIRGFETQISELTATSEKHKTVSRGIITILNKQKSQLEDQVAKFTISNAAKTATIAERNARISANSLEKQELEGKISRLTDELSRLRANYEIRLDTLQRQRESIERSKAEAATAHLGEIEPLRTQLAALTDQRSAEEAAFRAHIGGLDGQLVKLREELGGVTGNAASKASIIAEKEAAIGGLQSRIAGLEAQIETTGQEHKGKVDPLVARIAELEAAAEAAAQVKLGELGEKDAEIARLQKAATDEQFQTKQRLFELRTQLSKSQDHERRLAETLKSERSKSSEIKEELERLRLRHERSLRELEEERQKEEQRRLANRAIQANAAAKGQELDALRGQLQALTGQAAEAASTHGEAMAALTREKGELEAAVAAATLAAQGRNIKNAETSAATSALAARLEACNSEMERLNAEAEAAKGAHEAEISRLTESMNGIQAEVAAAREAAADAMRQKSANSQRIAELEARNRELESQMGALEAQKRAEYQAQINELRGQVASNPQVSTLTGDLGRLQKRYDAAKSHLKACLAEDESRKLKHSQNLHNAAEKERELASLREQIAALRQTTGETISAHESTISMLQSEKARLESGYAAAAARLAAATSKESENGKRNAERLAELGVQRAKLAELDAKIKELEGQAAAAAAAQQSQEAGLQASIDQLTSQLAAAQAEVQATQTASSERASANAQTIAEQKAEIEQLNEQIRGLSDKIHSELQGQMERLREELTASAGELASSSGASGSRIAALEQELSGLQGNYEELERQLGEAQRIEGERAANNSRKAEAAAAAAQAKDEETQGLLERIAALEKTARETQRLRAGEVTELKRQKAQAERLQRELQESQGLAKERGNRNGERDAALAAQGAEIARLTAKIQEVEGQAAAGAAAHQAELEPLRALIEQLRGEAAAARAEALAATQAVSAATAELAAAQEGSSAKNAAIAGLQGQKDDLEQQLSSLRDTISAEYAAQIRALSEQVQTSSGDAGSLRGEIQRLSGLQAELENTQHLLQEAIESDRISKASYLEKEREASAKSGELSRLEREFDILRRKTEEQSGLLARLTRERDELSSAYARDKAAAAAAAAADAEARGSINAERNAALAAQAEKIQGLSAEIERLTAAIAAAGATETASKATIQELRGLISRLQGEAAAANAASKSFATEAAARNTASSEQRSRNAEIISGHEATITRLREEISSINRDIDERSQAEIARLRGMLASSQGNLEASAADSSSLRGIISQLESQLAAKNAELQRARELERSEGEARSALAIASARIGELEPRLQALTTSGASESEEHARERERLEGELQRLRDSEAAARALVAERSAANANSAQRNAANRSEISRLEEELRSLNLKLYQAEVQNQVYEEEKILHDGSEESMRHELDKYYEKDKKSLSELHWMRQRVIKQAATIEELREQLGQKDSEIARLKQELEECRSRGAAHTEGLGSGTSGEGANGTAAATALPSAPSGEGANGANGSGTSAATPPSASSGANGANGANGSTAASSAPSEEGVNGSGTSAPSAANGEGANGTSAATSGEGANGDPYLGGPSVPSGHEPSGHGPSVPSGHGPSGHAQGYLQAATHALAPATPQERAHATKLLGYYDRIIQEGDAALAAAQIAGTTEEIKYGPTRIASIKALAKGEALIRALTLSQTDPSYSKPLTREQLTAKRDSLVPIYIAVFKNQPGQRGIFDAVDNKDAIRAAEKTTSIYRAGRTVDTMIKAMRDLHEKNQLDKLRQNKGLFLKKGGAREIIISQEIIPLLMEHMAWEKVNKEYNNLEPRYKEILPKPEDPPIQKLPKSFQAYLDKHADPELLQEADSEVSLMSPEMIDSFIRGDSDQDAENRIVPLYTKAMPDIDESLIPNLVRAHLMRIIV
jgi:chromosome segregation ATPase